MQRLPIAASVQNQLNCDVMAWLPLRRERAFDTVTGAGADTGERTIQTCVVREQECANVAQVCVGSLLSLSLSVSLSISFSHTFTN